MNLDRTIRSAIETATQAIGEAVQASVHAAQEAVNAMTDDFGCEEPDYHEVTSRHHALGLSGIRVSNRAGAVSLVGHDLEEVSVKAKVLTSADDLDGVLERAHHAVRREGVVLEVGAPSEPRTRIEYEIAVPRKLQVAISVGSGAVTVVDLDGPLEITSANGEVRVQNARGDVSVRTANGAVRVEDLGGSASLETKNGSVSATRVLGALEAQSANGAICIEESRSSLTVRTVNGRVQYRGEVLGDFDVSTTNGAITLSVPADSVFELDADVRVGQVDIDLPCSEGADAKRDPDEALPCVHLSSMVGRIAIEEL
jgi:hypothetical protein